MTPTEIVLANRKGLVNYYARLVYYQFGTGHPLGFFVACRQFEQSKKFAGNKQ
jgi:hypothetical protein